MSFANGAPGPYPQYSPYACQICKKRKRKCSNELPACTSCTSRQQRCEYTPPASLGNPSPAKPQPVVPKRALIPPSFPAHYFLDFASFQYRHGQIPLINIPLSPDLLDSYQDPPTTARLYFETVHPFLPFISKKNFYDHFPPPHVQPNVVFSILISCMKLVSWSPGDIPNSNDPKSASYIAIKRTLTETDLAGIFSLQLLQALILVSLYEMGHAIYPAAYMSVGTCARYALASGIDAYMTIDMSNPALTPLDQEEKRRAWWAVLILDRFVNIGYPKRPLTTQDPISDALLPADDTLFDQGIVTLDQLYTISSTPDLSMGSFAKLSQATYLLGRVLRHICDLTAERKLHQDEGIQLSNRLQTLLKVLESENQINSATAMCSSALMTLHDPNAARIDPMHLDFAMNLVKPVAEELPQSVADFLSANIDYQAHPSPLLGHWIYQAATVVGRLNAQTGDNFGRIENLLSRLEYLNRRWLVAGKF
ncbi:MAG: hypothetical protein Q9170_000213 [Blastenia crenularia]